MNVGELEWTATMRLSDDVHDQVSGHGDTPGRALDDLERTLACRADELAGRLERVREARRAVPLVP